MARSSLKYCACIFTFTIVIYSGNSFATKVPCPPLSVTPGIVVSCTYPNENDRKIPCTGPISGVPRKTIAKYKCEGDPEFSQFNLTCKCHGKWKGLEDFLSFSTNCGKVQHQFSLSGPPELNLTESEIKELDGNLSLNEVVANNETMAPYALEGLAYHNYYRKMHGASPLKLNQKLSQAAQNWAEHEASNLDLKTEPWSKTKTYISNMYLLVLGMDEFSPSTAIRLAVGRWYASSKDYDFEIPVANSFSAMIWNSTTDLGIGIACKNGNVLVVCNYSPPGNIYMVGGQNAEDSLSLFKKNVFPPTNTGIH